MYRAKSMISNFLSGCDRVANAVLFSVISILPVMRKKPSTANGNGV